MFQELFVFLMMSAVGITPRQYNMNVIKSVSLGLSMNILSICSTEGKTAFLKYGKAYMKMFTLKSHQRSIETSVNIYIYTNIYASEKIMKNSVVEHVMEK